MANSPQSRRVVEQIAAAHLPDLESSTVGTLCSCPSESCPSHSKSRDTFRRFAHRTSCIVGTPGAFLAALFVLIVWGISGPFFHYSDTWQLIINTGTTIITFLMVFLIQSTQNRDASAIHLKLDELIRSSNAARNDLVGLEHLTDAELSELEVEFSRLRRKAAALRGKRTQHAAGTEERDVSPAGSN